MQDNLYPVLWQNWKMFQNWKIHFLKRKIESSTIIKKQTPNPKKPIYADLNNALIPQNCKQEQQSQYHQIRYQKVLYMFIIIYNFKITAY